MILEISHYQRHHSSLPPIWVDLTQWTETAQLRRLDNRPCLFENGSFHDAQSCQPCSSSWETSNCTTLTSHWTFSFEHRAVVSPFPKMNLCFLLGQGLSCLQVLPASCQLGWLQSAVTGFEFPSWFRSACLSYGCFFGIGSCLPGRVWSPKLSYQNADSRGMEQSGGWGLVLTHSCPQFGHFHQNWTAFKLDRLFWGFWADKNFTTQWSLVRLQRLTWSLSPS